MDAGISLPFSCLKLMNKSSSPRLHEKDMTKNYQITLTQILCFVFLIVYRWYIHSINRHVDPFTKGRATLSKYVTLRLIQEIRKAVLPEDNTYFCGSGGCTLWIYERTGGGYRALFGIGPDDKDYVSVIDISPNLSRSASRPDMATRIFNVR